MAIRAEDITDRHTRAFYREHEEVCAARCLRLGPLFIPASVRQLSFYLLLLAGLLIFFLWDYKIFYTVLTFVLCGFYGLVILFRLSSVGLALARQAVGRPAEHRVGVEELDALDPAGLPVYTVLVPMYKEPEVAQKIARAVTELNYPKEKLDVKLLLEEDDPETRRKVEEVLNDLPSCVEVVVCPKVPKGEPRTKPRACNWGLERAKGEYLVIFDAEDRPDPDQLKKAVVTFRRLEAQGKRRVVCLQAKLNYFNPRQNALTRFFTLEYTTWFDLFLPGLHAFRIPIPLGGTSNHFRTDVLRELGGWDPFNVTEDCDLGMRMARRGYATEVLDSTTWEEANSHVGNWIRQRSRWVKGYFQTHLVHTRDSVWPHFLLAGFFYILAGLIGRELSNPMHHLAGLGGLIAALRVFCLCCAGAAAGLGLWSVAEWLTRRASGKGQEGRLGLYDALTFRLTVGGLSGMLLLNVIFWCLSGLYLFREPLSRVLPERVELSARAGTSLTPRETLRTWKLYYTNVTEERFNGYTIYNTTWQWLIARTLSWPDAREIFAAIDVWSFWSQLLYPVALGLFLANFIFVALGLVSCAKRGLWDLAPFALLVPCYWVLISVAAYKGAWQLFWNPWYWEKTAHGLTEPPTAKPQTPDGGGFQPQAI